MIEIKKKSDSEIASRARLLSVNEVDRLSHNYTNCLNGCEHGLSDCSDEEV